MPTFFDSGIYLTSTNSSTISVKIRNRRQEKWFDRPWNIWCIADHMASFVSLPSLLDSVSRLLHRCTDTSTDTRVDATAIDKKMLNNATATRESDCVFQETRDDILLDGKNYLKCVDTHTLHVHACCLISRNVMKTRGRVARHASQFDRLEDRWRFETIDCCYLVLSVDNGRRLIREMTFLLIVLVVSRASHIFPQPSSYESSQQTTKALRCELRESAVLFTILGKWEKYFVNS